MINSKTVWPNKEVTLEKVKFKIQSMIEKKTLADMEQVKFEQYLDDMLERMVFNMRMILMGEKLKEIRVSYPQDWWEAVKERFAPRWFVRKWPVKHKTYELTARAVYPLISLPEQKHFLDFKTVETGDFQENRF